MHSAQGSDRPGGVPVRGRARIRRVRRTTGRVLRNRADILAVIAGGGALGSLARWGLARAWPVVPGGFARGTLVANVSGCLVLGIFMIFVLDVWPPSRYVRPFLGVGVLGGFTTFSTAMVDTRAQLVAGHAGQAGLYLGASLAGGLVAVWVGMVLARAIVLAVRGWARRRRGSGTAGSPRDAGPRDNGSPSAPPPAGRAARPRSPHRTTAPGPTRSTR